MCGIAGLIAVDGLLPSVLRGVIEPMTDVLRHRGPDGSGFFQDDVAALGHRRLAIIDRAAGVQPMPNEDRTCWVVFNGEIYNHHGLRDRLTARGHRFRTHSDTEAIVHAYEEYGTGCVDHMEGMFAFAVYNQRTRELFAARDRLGKKPFFYATLGGTLHFASEIKSLQQSPLWSPAVDLDQLETYLTLGYTIAPDTVYSAVKQIEPGHWLQVRNGQIASRQYWDIAQFDDLIVSDADAIQQIEAHLDAHVQERLESEVPLGAFLSGGIDSGLVVSSMSKAGADPLVTATVGFNDRDHNELEPAALTAARYRTSHHGSIVEPRLDQVFDRIVKAFDQPFADSSVVPTYYVSREARRHVTVALSGDGGDETFGGYTFRYIPHAIEDRVRRVLPASVARATGALGTRWPRSKRLPRAFRIGTYLENLSRDAASAYYFDLCFMSPFDARALMGKEPASPYESETYEAVTAPYRRCPSHDAVQRAEYADVKVYLPNDVLAKVDRMSMQHGLEVRCPLLDRRLVELAFRLPQSQKRAARTGKYLLKEIARRRLPAELLSRPKQGFAAPVGSWIAGPYADAFRDEVLSSRAAVAELIDARVLRQWFDEHRRGDRDWSYPLWSAWVLARWAEIQKTVRPAMLEGPAPSSAVSAGLREI
jgi:asparagine synthase (glutamine-hydrolysing)